MRVFFIGSVQFSMEMLNTLLQIPEVRIIGIATKSKSNFNADHCDLSPLAITNNIPYMYVKDINAVHIVDWIKSLSPEVILCFGWSSIIKKPILILSPLGVIGYHPAKLPHNRGRHPIIWALALGLKKTASTFFKMDEGADSGDLISQEEVSIEFKDTAQTLYSKLTEKAKTQLIDYIPKLAKNELNYIPQNNDYSNHWRKRGKKDGEIDFRMSSLSIYNLVRALTKPYVGAHVLFKAKEYKIWKCAIGPKVKNNHEPGKVLEVEENYILVKTTDKTIYLLEHEIDYPVKENEYFE